jgi:hypothetical protein
MTEVSLYGLSLLVKRMKRYVVGGELLGYKVEVISVVF